MSKLTLILLGLYLNQFFSFGQIEVPDDPVSDSTSTTQGFFVNNGLMKISELECYNFKDLIVSFDLNDLYFTYDNITIRIQVGNPEISNGTTSYYYSITGEEFNRLFNGNSYAYFKLFSNTDLEEESRWRTKARYEPDRESLTRSRLQHTSIAANVENSILLAEINCGKITGSKMVYSTDSYGNRVAREVDEWDWEITATFQIPLKNRIKLKFLKGYPKIPEGSGDCYN